MSKWGITMKKISLLILLLIPCLAYAEAPYNFAKYWNSLTPGEKVAYVEGYKTGVAEAVVETLSVFHSPHYNKNMPIRDQIPAVGIFEVEDTDILIKVISSFYKDPGNSYIQINDMILLARDKIVGKPIESALQTARRKALRAHELKRKIMNKDK